ncbi:MAG TPA: hypothetical protein VN380_14535 [Thermoanaerobaculia bacterium]|nr:hypothetical protein [Thermoanaerobaculia bacterium]
MILATVGVLAGNVRTHLSRMAHDGCVAKLAFESTGRGEERNKLTGVRLS